MSDIGIELPVWVIPVMFGAIYWPLTLFFGCLSLYVGVLRVRGIARIVFIAIALPLIADAGLGIYYAIAGY
ncbi:hypothetical protein [Burkholderia pseudomultivorans]|uniref:Uncharacterized protein n=1 Tax=Burkholderia pseudomultivorans TaxID=1207504 RepID=A0A132F3A6_9BURK|nr:hypothetical protein [Burkholderia pseudomultivorans]EGD05599.1 hypothetical protein B1M_05596 [Burkholderia sp. TJI49]KWF67529.1 hypothetical protein WT57_15650 [Burkholderia pseudomultivorans]KWI52203.1 hypothetical protein WT72_22305 [Burkholderia pseudomultivorans]MBF5008311.1 hypothetical protein [Burkholderia pseudomultivorans]MDS0856915.1 hypothetical protein [Burkholderia pseudomultivorans]